ncbi:MAG: efflux RND transporter periplasmic adaptor subunit [candidate division Zixibacteria bacterium]|nr:efflux RND transporter periplasmic adaptor subunit [candidate division Zixibacteria bacterium]
MAKKKRKKLIWFSSTGLIIIAVIVVIGLQSNGDEQTTVQADLAYIDDISEKVTASGRIQPQTKVDISAEVSAEIIGLHIREGDFVKRGALLLTLDTVQLKSDLYQAKYSLDETLARTASAKAQFKKDSREYERQIRLFNQKLISETEFADGTFIQENSKANYEARKAQVNISQAILDKARDNLGKTRITSPMDGIVTYLNVEVGEIAQAQTAYTQGRRLMTIADLSVFEVEVDIDETEIAKLRINQKAQIRVDAFRDTTFLGTVVEIGNSAKIMGEGTEDYSTNFLVKIRFDETNTAIRPGMSATTDITTAQALNALLIPYGAVVTREFNPDSLPANVPPVVNSQPVKGINASFATATNASDSKTSDNNKGPKKKKEKTKLEGVFVVENGEAKFFAIKTGIADDRNIAVLSGLNPADTIVSGSYQTLRQIKEGEVVVIDDDSLEKMKEFEDSDSE